MSMKQAKIISNPSVEIKILKFFYELNSVIRYDTLIRPARSQLVQEVRITINFLEV